MTNWQIIALVAGGIGILLGILLARRSHQEIPLLSGVAHLFHYLAAAVVGAVPFGIITGIIIGDLGSGVRVAVGALLVAILLVIVYAIPESLARRSDPKLKSSLSRLAWDRWVIIARPIGDFNARVLMGVFYFTLLLPFGLISRLGSDRLRLQMPAAGEALWQGREQSGDQSVDEARRQF